MADDLPGYLIGHGLLDPDGGRQTKKVCDHLCLGEQLEQLVESGQPHLLGHRLHHIRPGSP